MFIVHVTGNFGNLGNFDNLKKRKQRYPLGCSKKTLFQNKNKRNPPRISLGVSLKGSKRIFDFDKV